MRWRPLRSRDSESAAAEYDELHEGAPDWLLPSVIDWLVGRMHASYADYDHSQPPNLVENLQRLLRLTGLDWRQGTESAGNSLIQRIANGDSELALEVLDATLHLGDSYQAADPANALGGYLEQAASVWRVVPDPAGGYALERRVSKEVMDAAHFVMSDDSRVSQHLRTAWHDAYAVAPNPSHAYREAVRAVEVIARPILAPKDPIATLGKMITYLRDGASKWTTVFADSPTDGVDVVLRNMQLLWHSQFDRHGTDDESVPLTVGVEEARAAVHLAVLLTHWFRSGVIVAKK